jgi:hypothetical protein
MSTGDAFGRHSGAMQRIEPGIQFSVRNSWIPGSGLRQAPE